MTDSSFEKSDISRAVDAGILTPQDAAAFEKFLSHGELPVLAGGSFDGETPRLVRGFHDVLISMGLIVGTIGIVFGLGNFVAAVILAVVSFVLAIYLTKRLRLALPSLVLALVFAFSASFLGLTVGISLLSAVSFESGLENTWILTGGFVVGALAAGIHFAAFRIPISFAMLVLGLAAALGLVVSQFIGVTPLSINLITLVISLALFLMAVRMDMSDPERRTMKSDYAFWIHLVTAPMLLGSLMGLLFGKVGFSVTTLSMQTSDYLTMMVVLAVLAAIAILIDRRAFLVSGLGYLGVAVYKLLQAGSVPDEGIGLFSITLIVLSCLIVGIGLAWHQLRAVLLNLVPAATRQKLPPIRN
jgi:hypothetical protein